MAYFVAYINNHLTELFVVGIFFFFLFLYALEYFFMKKPRSWAYALLLMFQSIIFYIITVIVTGF